MKIEELKVDANLVHLENVLFDLDSYSFDKDILKLLSDLKELVDKKLYSDFNKDNLDIKDLEIIYKYHLKDINS